MDPNANLEQQNRLLGSTDQYDKDRLQELREALEGWITSGGFAPDWAKYPDATTQFDYWSG